MALLLALLVVLTWSAQATFLDAPVTVVRVGSLTTTVRAPMTCPCSKQPSTKTGKCYYYKNEATGSCAFRPCKESYVCDIGGTLLCLRRNVHKRIVLVAPQMCRTVPVKRIMYVPYSNLPQVPKKIPIALGNQSGAAYAAPQTPGARTLAEKLKAGKRKEALLAAKLERLRLKEDKLKAKLEKQKEKDRRRAELLRRKHRRQAELLRRKLRRARIAKRKKVARLRRIRAKKRRLAMQQRSLSAGLRPAEKVRLRKLQKVAKDSYIPVAGTKVLGNFDTLPEAEKPLEQFLPKARLIRAIFRVHKLKVLPMPLKAGNYYWGSPKDVRSMYQTGQVYNKKRVQKMVRRKKYWYVLVVDKRAKRFRTLRAAKKALAKIPTTSTKLRGIFRVRSGKLTSKQPLNVGNRYFLAKGGNERRKLYLVAKWYLKRLRVLKKKGGKVAQKKVNDTVIKKRKKVIKKVITKVTKRKRIAKITRFYVLIDGRKARRFRKLKEAKAALAKVAGKDPTKLRGIFVVNKKVLAKRPLKAGQYYFQNEADEAKLRKVAVWYLKRLSKFINKKKIKPSVTTTTTTTTNAVAKPKKKYGKVQYYIVAADRSAFGEYPLLSDAKQWLVRFGKAKRCRAVFAVVGGEVQPKPLKTGNYLWKDQEEVDGMFNAAKVYNAKISKLVVNKAVVEVSGKFLLVADDKDKEKMVIGLYRSLSVAKAEMLKRFKPKSTRSRCIFEVKGGQVVADPHIVGGQNQGAGMRTGFNKFWWDYDDIEKLYRGAKQWWALKKE